MGLERIDGLGAPKIPSGDRFGFAEGAGPAGPAFGDLLRQALDEANRLQSSADAAIQELAAGREGDVTEVMTAVEKADLAFRTLMQVRNKLVDAYEELMRLRI
jgi:flagellar hook-basal body complex protein FliE